MVNICELLYRKVNLRTLPVITVLAAAFLVQVSASAVSATASCPCDIKKITKPGFAKCVSAYAGDDVDDDYIGLLDGAGIVQLLCRDTSNKTGRQSTLIAHRAGGEPDYSVATLQTFKETNEPTRTLTYKETDLTADEFDACAEKIRDDAAALGCEPNVGNCLTP